MGYLFSLMSLNKFVDLSKEYDTIFFRSAIEITDQQYLQ